MRGLAYSAGYGNAFNVSRNPDHKRSEPAMATRFVPDYPQSTQPPKIITCTNGMEVLVDADDYPILSRHSWYINYSKEKPYCITKLKTDQSTIWRCIFMHHMILGGGSQTDHRDGNTLNNQKHNLRPANHQQNGWNTGKRKRCRHGEPKSQYKGVSPYKTKSFDGWQVIIKLTKKGERPAKHKRLGPFKTELEAAMAYNAEIVKIRGAWAWQNPISAESKGGE